MMRWLRPRPPICPSCRAEVEGVTSWWGLVRRNPGRCQACGAHLAYDTVGGVYVVNEDALLRGSEHGSGSEQ